MDSKKFNQIVKNKKEALKKIKDSKYPIIPNMAERHEERVHRASDYIFELEDLILATDKPIYVVSKGTFNKRVNEADFASIESDGLFHMLGLVSSFPNTEYYVVWLAPLSDI